MKRTLAVLLACAFIQDRICSEDITAAAGNSAGESSQMAGVDPNMGGPSIPRPGQMVISSADRVGLDAILLYYNYPLVDYLSNDTLVFFRAMNSDPWERANLNRFGGDKAYDADAPAGNEYRYTACLARDVPLLDRGSIESNAQAYSKPSSVKLVADTPCGLWAAERGNGQDTGLAGHVMIPLYVKDTPSAGMNAPPPPNPYDFDVGNLANTTISSDPIFSAMRDVYETGYIATGQLIGLSGSYSGPGPNGFSYPSIGLIRQVASGVSNPFESPIPNTGGRYMLTMNGAKFAAYRAEYSGDYAQGYDAASNPNSQMLPRSGTIAAGSTRDVTFKVLPDWNGVPVGSYHVNDGGTSIADPATGNAADSVNPGDNSRRIKIDDQSNLPGSTGITVDNMAGMLACDVRKCRELKIKIVNIRLTYPPGSSPAHVGDLTADRQFWPLTEDYAAFATRWAPVGPIQQALNDTYGKQANVWITVEVDPTTLIIDDYDTYLTMSEANVATHPITIAARQNRANGYKFTIFQTNRMGIMVNGMVHSSWAQGLTNDNDPDNALFALLIPLGKDTFVHEIGHLLGLEHTWIPDTSYTESAVPDDARRRIMCYDRYSGTGVLIKPERDVIHHSLDVLRVP